MKVSKHHYAIEMAKRGNTVYFIESPDRSRKKGIAVRPVDNVDGLNLVSYSPVFWGKRVLPGFIYRRLLRKQINRLVGSIGKNPDLVLTFQPYLFENIGDFGAARSIYFASDLSLENRPPGEAVNADVCFAVSATILDQVKQYNPHSFFINHGLSGDFKSIAVTAAEQPFAALPKNKILQVGYAGNLLMGALDRQTMKKVITDNPEIRFVFWGQYDMVAGKHDAWNHPEVGDFVSFLKQAENVVLRGAVPTDVLAKEMQNMDMLWLCWKIGPGMWDGSNSHKILEYLSTGRPVVSHFVLTYKDSDILYMPKTTSNDEYPELFEKVVRKLRDGEIVVPSKAQIAFALDNTYARQIERIETYL